MSNGAQNKATVRPMAYQSGVSILGNATYSQAMKSAIKNPMQKV